MKRFSLWPRALWSALLPFVCVALFLALFAGLVWLSYIYPYFAIGVLSAASIAVLALYLYAQTVDKHNDLDGQLSDALWWELRSGVWSS